jgi:thermitase
LYIVLAVILILFSPTAECRNVPGEVIIRFHPGTPAADAARAIADAGGTQADEIRAIRFRRIKLPPGRTIEETIARLSRNPNIEIAEPNQIFYPASLPNDPLLSDQWALDKIGAKRAWTEDVSGNRGSVSTIIAILDSGISMTHEDVSTTKIVGARNFTTTSTTSFEDDCGHGTHVASIAAGATDNGVGMAGVAWEARIMPLKVMAYDGKNGGCTGNAFNIAAATIWAAENGARVINLSLSSCNDAGTDCGNPLTIMAAALEYANRRGVVLVAAAGNASTTLFSYPAAYPYVLGISATDRNDAVTTYSNHGLYIDLAAPGGSDACGDFTAAIVGPCAGADECYSPIPPAPTCTGPACLYVQVPCPTSSSSYTAYAGTSFASPHVAGLAAVLVGQDPSRTAEEIIGLMERTADMPSGYASWNGYYGYGRINMYRALTEVSPALAPAPTTVSAYAFPNPFSPVKDVYATIVIEKGTGNTVAVDIFDVSGARVWSAGMSVAETARTDFFHNSPLRWYGKDSEGRPLPGGIYTARIRVNDAMTTKRIVIAR